MNKPIVNELSVLLPENTKAKKREIIIPLRNNSLKTITEFHVAYDCLQYPLLFPYGNPGYHLNRTYIKNDNQKSMTSL